MTEDEKQKGYLYTVEFAESPAFRASGFDAAYRVARRVGAAIEAALAADKEAYSVEHKAYMRAHPHETNLAAKKR